MGFFDCLYFQDLNCSEANLYLEGEKKEKTFPSLTGNEKIYP